MRVLLDTNIWSYIGRQEAADQLVQLERSRSIRVVVHPAALLEAFASEDPQLRAAVADAMTRRPRPALLPEAAKEAAELVNAVRAHRPQWLRQVPRRDRVRHLERFWLRRLWRDARNDLAKLEQQRPAVLPMTESIARHLETQQRDAQRQAREQAMTLDPHGAVYRLTEHVPDSYMPGWDRSDDMAPWRVDMAGTFWTALTALPARATLGAALGEHVDTTSADWVDPFVSLRRLTGDGHASFNRLILYELEVEQAPVNWLRSTFEQAQLAYKIGRGNPWDAAQATYALEVDVLLTSDKRFRHALVDIAARAPAPIADVKLVPADTGNIVDAIGDVLA